MVPRAPSDGERWTEEVLAELRDSRYSTAGWTCFLRRSLDRAATERRRRPALARQVRGFGAAGMAMWLATQHCLRAVGRHPPAVLAGGAWWAAAWAMLRWHIGMVEGENGGRCEQLSAADAATLGRLWAAPLLLMRDPRRVDFAVLTVFCGLSDLADGRLARRAGPTRLGRSLDHSADVAVSAAAAVAVARAGWVSRGPAGLLLARGAGSVLFASAHYFIQAQAPPRDFAGARWTGSVLYAGLVAAALGRPRTADALVGLSALGGALPAIASWRWMTASSPAHGPSRPVEICERRPTRPEG